MRGLFYISLFLSAAAHAQVPAGSFVVCSRSDGAGSAGGVWIVDPRVPGPGTPIQGLDPGLVGGASTPSAIAVRNDGVILVGEYAPPQSDVALYEFTVSGTTAVPIRRTVVGRTGPYDGGISGIDFLPNGDAVFSVLRLTNQPPLNLAKVGYYASDTGVVTALQTPSSMLDAYAIAADSSGSVYVGGSVSGGFAASRVFSIPIAGGPPRPFSNIFLTTSVSSLAVDQDGDLVALLWGWSSGPSLAVFDANTGNVRQLPSVGRDVVGMALESVTGDLVLTRESSSSLVRVDQRGTGSQHAYTATIPLAGAIAVFDNPLSYGIGTAGSSSFTWQVMPSPGGLPRAGNAAFGLQLDASGGDATGAVLVGARSSAMPVFGLDLLVTPWSTFPMPASGIVPLPISSSAAIGLTLAMQSVHLDSGAPQGIAASNGYQVTIMP